MSLLQFVTKRDFCFRYGWVLFVAILIISSLIFQTANAASYSYQFEPDSNYATNEARAALKIFPGSSGINPTRVVWLAPGGSASAYCSAGSCGPVYEQSVSDNGALVWRSFYFYINGQNRATGTYTAVVYHRQLVGGIYVETELMRANFTIGSAPLPSATPPGAPTATPPPAPTSTPLAGAVLDSSFGTSGATTTDFNGHYDRLNAMAIQGDDKIVVAGESLETGTDVGAFALARYNPDGSLDSNFGSGGKLITEFTGYWWDKALGVTLQADNKIVAVGSSVWDMALARYNSDGSLDPSFGSGGKVTNAAAYRGTAVAIDANGKIVVAGDNFENFTVARFNANGSLDSSFGSAGASSIDFGGQAAETRGISIQEDGKIVIVGSTQPTSSGGKDIALARFNPDGSLDSTFGVSGKIVTNCGEEDIAESVLIDSDGNILVAINSGEYGYSYLAVARYLPDGTLDNHFGLGGIAWTSIGGKVWGANHLAFLPDGRIVAVGFSESDQELVNAVAVAVFTPDGVVDTLSGWTSGTASYQYGTARTVAVQQDGTLIVAGDNQNDDFLLLKYKLLSIHKVFLPALPR